LPAEEIEYLRWRSERWLKLRHFWPALAHSPGFVMRHGPAMLAHTFRGSSWRSAVGLESDRQAFARYRALRRAEREWLWEGAGSTPALDAGGRAHPRHDASRDAGAAAREPA
jgi:hypothetical protein